MKKVNEQIGMENANSKQKYIPVVFATDNNYHCLIVLLVSLLKYRGMDTFYNIYILVDDEFSKDSKQNIRKFCFDKENECSIQFINVGQQFASAQIHIQGITKPTYYRLLISQLLKEERCIYLDTDILVMSDLWDLYTQPIDEYYIAGVRALNWNKVSDKEACCKQAMLPDMNQYINAGVLLMNLKKIREDKIDQKFIDLIDMNFKGQDQDIINHACYGRIYRLPFVYNVMPKYATWTLEECQDVFSQEEIYEAWNSPKIIHYANPKDKPWKNLDCPLGDLWWEVCKNSPVWEYFYNYAQKDFFTKAFYQEKSQSYYTKIVPYAYEWSDTKEYVIYGAGKRATEIVSYLRSNNIEPCYILVSDKSNLKTAIQDIDIFELSEKKDELHDKTIVVATREALQKEIIQSLFYVEYKELIPISDGWMNS